MRVWLTIALLFSAFSARASELHEAITSVELSPGLKYSAVSATKFPSLTDAQKFAATKNLSEVTLRIHLNLSQEDCRYKVPALSLGYVYDQDIAFFNGQLIGLTGNPELSKRRLSLIPRVYPIASQIFNCPGANYLDLSLKRILGGWIGPFAGKIELGEFHELQQKASVTEAMGPLLQRDIGILLLAISVLLISLFSRYPDNHRQTAFVAFAFSAALLCLSLSGWYYRYFDFPEIIFRLHFVLISVALSTQILFIAAYRGLAWTKRIPKRLFLVAIAAIFSTECFAIPSVGMLLNIYLYQLLVLICTSIAIYLLPVLSPKRVPSERNLTMELSLFLIHFGAAMDIARIWKLHNFENISPYTYGLSIFVIGSILASELVRVFQKAAQTAEAESRLKVSQKQTEFARQVGHDIRSPLAALNMVTTLLRDVPEDQRLVIRNVAQRINDIANTLLDRAWPEPKDEAESFIRTETQGTMLSSLVDSIVSEKRVQYRDRDNIDIEIDLSASYGLFSSVNATAFARALSNLIDNSVEATDKDVCKISVTVRADGEHNVISVSDNGRGIPKSILDLLGSQGASFGKEAGFGLGLYQAKSSIEAVGGALQIQSLVGSGTTVTISLPQAQAPEWFLNQLTLSKGTQVISIDDDQTVHQIWKSRLQSRDQSVSHVSFTSVAQFEEWLSTNKQLPLKFLVDYEFLGHEENGLQVIERLDIAGRAVLVSSRAEDFNVQSRAKVLGLKLIPKGLAAIIPINAVDA